MDSKSSKTFLSNSKENILPTTNSLTNTIILFLLITIVYTTIAFNLIHTGQFNSDEGFYCLAAKKALEGKIPHKDFAYTQMPLLPYVNGLMMKIFGFGYLQQRTINAFWGFLTISIVFYIVLRSTDKYSAFIAAWATATSLFWVHYICMGKSYAAAGLFLILAMLATFIQRPYYQKVIFFSLAGMLSIGCRLTVAPTVLVIGAFLLLQAETRKNKIICIAIPLLTGIILFLPFLLADSKNFLFWNLKYHLASCLNRRGWITINEHFFLAPSVILIMISGIILVISKFKRFKLQELSALTASVAGIVAQLSLKSTYGENSAPFIPLGAIGAVVVLSKWKHTKKLYIAVVIFSILVCLGPKPIKEDYMLKALANTARFVNTHTSPESPILTGFPIIAIEAKREVFEKLEMGMFSLTTEMSEDEANYLHIVTPAVLTEWVKTKKAGAVVLNCFPSTWNFFWSVPSIQPADMEKMSVFSFALAENYDIAFKEYPFAVFLPKSAGQPEP